MYFDRLCKRSPCLIAERLRSTRRGREALPVIAPDAFRDQPVLIGDHVRLEPLTVSVLADYLMGLRDPEVRHLTGSRVRFERETVEQWLITRHDRHDRADWAVVRRVDGIFLGEAVVNDLDAQNQSANYRVWLSGPEATGRGYGTEVTRLAVAYALDDIGLHRVGLSVFDFNQRARLVYERCGFRQDGRLRDALLWDGEWHDEILMSVLSTDERPARLPSSPATTPVEH